MQALKALVIGMGLLIVGGMMLLGWGLYQKSNNPDFKLFKSTEPAREAPADASTGSPGVAPPLSGEARAPGTAAFGEVRVDLPAGAEVVGTEVADGRLVAEVVLAEGGRLVVIVDLARGVESGRVVLQPAR